MDTNNNPSVWIFVAACLVSATSGVAAYLKTGKTITFLSLITVSLNSGLLGLSVSLLWFRQFRDNIHSLLGLCVLMGLVGSSGQEIFLKALQNWMLNLAEAKSDKNQNNNAVEKAEEKPNE